MKKQTPTTVFSGRGRRFAVAVADFNAAVTGKLLAGCLAAFKEAGAPAPLVVQVPGAFELPQACMVLARTRRYAAVVALGCVIRGETPHDRYISQAVAQGLMRVGLETGVPAVFGVLTPLTIRQALARSGGVRGNKGRDAALAALQMSLVLSQVRSHGR